MVVGKKITNGNFIELSTDISIGKIVYSDSVSIAAKTSSSNKLIIFPIRTQAGFMNSLKEIFFPKNIWTMYTHYRHEYFVED